MLVALIMIWVITGEKLAATMVMVLLTGVLFAWTVWTNVWLVQMSFAERLEEVRRYSLLRVLLVYDVIFWVELRMSPVVLLRKMFTQSI